MATVVRPGQGRHPIRRPLANFGHNPSSPLRHVDIVLVAAVGIISLFGAVMVYSATRGPGPDYDSSFLKKVLVFVVLGAILMAGTAFFDYRRLIDLWPVIFGGSTLLLLLVLTPIGESVSGTQGWFQIGPFQLQPSELAKLGLIIGFSGLASQFRGDLDLRRVVMLLAVCGVPMVLVMLQPDLGTTLVSVTVSFALLLVAGVPTRVLAALAVVAVLGTAVVLTSGVLKDYQRDRLTTFIDQDSASATASDAAAFNLEAAKQAIGSGGLWGKGLFNGPYTKGANVPEQQTDFIFTAVGEQFGFVGAGLLVGALGVVVWRVWRTAQLARDEFGTLLCTGVMVMILVQAFENIGMTMGIMPITGIPLPFVSYGGSSLLTMFIGVGLVLSVHMRRFS